MAVVKLDPDFAEVLGAVVEDAEAEGIGIVLVSGYRSIALQRRLFAEFRAGRRRGPVAAPGSSYHNYGLAVDIATTPPAALQRVGQIAEDYGLRWGGRFGDPVHIDAGDTLSIAQAKAGFNPNDLVEVTN